MKKSKIRKAYDYACEMHKGQKRKYSGNEYIIHPVRVAKIVNLISDSDADMICAALLHDVIEDSEATYKDVAMRFGKVVADMVLELSNNDDKGKNRATRKKMACDRMLKASVKSKTIKLADIIDNLKSIRKYDVKFRDVFFAEKKLMIELLHEGDKILYKKAVKIIEEYYKD